MLLITRPFPLNKPFDSKIVHFNDICVIDFDQNAIEGSLSPSIEAGMHIAIYQNRPDVNAVIHTHQPFASVLAVIGKPIPALLDEITVEIGHVVDIVPYAYSSTSELVNNVIGKLDNACQCRAAETCCHYLLSRFGDRRKNSKAAANRNRILCGHA